MRSRQPEVPGTGGPASDDAAVAAGQSGSAHRIEKPRAAVAEADLGGVADATRPDTAAINAKPGELSEEAAKAMDRKGELQRPVLTPAGWYVPQNSRHERQMRKRNGEAELVEID